MRSARNVAMDLLSRREHSRKQLCAKLSQRGFENDEITAALDKLQCENLLNDSRFAESYVNQRIQRGYGPVRIRQELGERGITADLIQLHMDSIEQNWSDLMREQRVKKYGAEIPQDFKEKMKQARFLQNRGFSPESVMRLFLE